MGDRLDIFLDKAMVVGSRQRQLRTIRLAGEGSLG